MKPKKSNINGALIGLGIAALIGIAVGFRKGAGIAGPLVMGYNPDVFSRYYTLDDVSKSATATAQMIDNIPPDRELENASILAQMVLDPLTDQIGAKLIINSWYRSKRLNEIVGGSDFSDHLEALAVDVENPNGNNIIIAKKMLQHDIPFDQMIVYDSLTNPSRIHLSFDPTTSNQKKEILLKKNKSYIVKYPNEILQA